MPTDLGSETIGERLARHRAALTRVRETIARHETNGQASNLGGTMVTEIAYDRALSRARELESAITALEARLAGSAARPGLALTSTNFD